MIITKNSEDTDVRITYSRGVFTISGYICDGLNVDMKLQSGTAVKIFIEELQNIHGLETGLALRVFDMSERVYS